MEETPGSPASTPSEPMQTSPSSTQPSTPSSQEASSSEPWYTALPDDLKMDKNITKFQSVAELAKGYNNASAMIGRDKIPMPQTDEEMRNVQLRLGMPMKHTEYKVGPELGHEWVTEDFAVSPEPGVELDKWKDCYKQLCHEYGFTQKQAAKMYERVARETNALEKRKAAAVEAEMVQCGNTLKMAWGESHNINTLIAGKAAKMIFGEDLTKKINDMGLGRDPQFVMAMHKIGSRSLEEMGIDAKGASSRTPADLDGEIKALMGHPSYMNKKHPEHKQTVGRVTALMQRRHPENAV